jgi:hypothetical protein
VTPDTVKIGRLSFSLRAFYISIVGAVITVPPILLFDVVRKNIAFDIIVSSNSVIRHDRR